MTIHVTPTGTVHVSGSVKGKKNAMIQLLFDWNLAQTAVNFASHTWYVQIVATTMASKLLILTTNINIKKDPFLGAGPERVFFYF